MLCKKDPRLAVYGAAQDRIRGVSRDFNFPALHADGSPSEVAIYDLPHWAAQPLAENLGMTVIEASPGVIRLRNEPPGAVVGTPDAKPLNR